MNRVRAYGRIAAAVVILLIVAQVSVSLLVSTRRVRRYLIAHLEEAFGRPVEVNRVSVQIVPLPELSLDGVTVGEDPAFGQEYFLRTEHMGASLRWRGLFRGHFEFGTISLTRPSLILVRNQQGRWNLEDWLPPARSAAARADSGYGTQPPPQYTHHLRRIEIEDGRISFKLADDKSSFAFTSVSGRVEQVGTGRWQLRIEAQPWRSGVGLQSTGIVQVRGDIAGTSTRLRPAEIHVHWEKVSLADLFRLVKGYDPGVRGELALDGNASVGAGLSGDSISAARWQFDAQARAAQVHRWDLTERPDNPRVNVSLKGTWNPAGGDVHAEELKIETPRSHMRGHAWWDGAALPNWDMRIDSAVVQAQDVLDWYRAFHAGVADELSVQEFLTGRVEVRGWPVQLYAAEISGEAGIVQGAGLTEAVQIDPFRGNLVKRRLMIGPVRLLFGLREGSSAGGSKSQRATRKPQPGAISANTIQSVFLHDFSSEEGMLRVYVRMADASRAFRAAAAFGRPLNRGWDVTGNVGGTMELDWKRKAQQPRWRGSFDLTNVEMQVAGLNQPLAFGDARLEWKDGRRSFEVKEAEAFGASWSGAVIEDPRSDFSEPAGWHFQLHADRLEAAELDRWFGPRARPNWLQRLLTSFIGSGSSTVRGSELLRHISADGEISADRVSVERVELARVRARISLRDLQLHVQDVEAEWAGGKVRGEMHAEFSSSPTYRVSAEVDRVNLAQLPWAARWADRWSGAASGNIQLSTQGVGREDLLKQLSGGGDLQLRSVEFRGWDVASSVESGVLRTGSSRWSGGEGEFTIEGRTVSFGPMRFDGSGGSTELTATIDFGQEGKFTFAPFRTEKADNASNTPTARAFLVSGPLDAPVARVVPTRTGTTRR